MACRPSYQGSRLVMDCATCGLGLSTSACINSHLRTIATLDSPWKTMRYEEETIVELGEEDSKVFSEYIAVVRQVESLLLNPQIYGRQDDEGYSMRQKLIKEFYELMFQNPMVAVQTLKDYKEPLPLKSAYMDGYRTFQSWVNGIIAAFTKTRLYQLSTKHEDLRQSFLSILKLKSMPYVQAFVKTIPPAAKLIDDKDSQYELPFGIKVKIYEIPGSDSYLYMQENPVIESLPHELSTQLAEVVSEELKSLKENVDYTTIFESKMRTFRQKFVDWATRNNAPITQQQALAMGREAAAWSVGLGSPIENLALDRENLTDVYIDSENAAIYLEHQKFGLCHTLFQYNHEMLERAFRNVMIVLHGTRKFDKDNPVVDVVLTRLAMRCHLQQPPATFGDLQAALRIMKEQPFTYAEYLYYKSFTPFFAGYDDVMVSLGCSEAVLGLKGVGKTAFTSAKIAAIGTKRRILPIQDIEEIPTRAYRKRGFHIGAMRVQSSDREESQTSELDLVSMTNASLRMGDACVIINEIRSRTAIQGVINMLNTQPGIFLLYNLHAQSLKDIQDRLELVFGMPAASMYSTDRYSFLKKIRFGRGSRVYRMLGFQYETDLDKHQFVPVFTLQRGDEISKTKLICSFLDIPEASATSLAGASLSDIAKKLKPKFVPPALKRRSEETGLSVNDYIMEAFFKGWLYDKIYEASVSTGDKMLLELDFVLKCTSAANIMLREFESTSGSADWGKMQKQMGSKFDTLLEQDMKEREVQIQKPKPPPSGAKAQADMAKPQPAAAKPQTVAAKPAKPKKEPSP